MSLCVQVPWIRLHLQTVQRSRWIMGCRCELFYCIFFRRCQAVPQTKAPASPRGNHRAQAHSHMCRVRRNGCPKTGKRVFCLTAGLMGEVMQLNTEDWQMSRDVNTQRHLKSASPTDSRACCCCQLAFLPSLLSARFPTFKDISSCAQRCAFHWSSVIISHFNDQS